MSTTDKLEQYKVHKIQELKRHNRRDEAREILERISKQVQPILRKRQWTVPLLREFLPKNPNLLVWFSSYLLDAS
jgi:DNA-dependent metalloprotease WSS1